MDEKQSDPNNRKRRLVNRKHFIKAKDPINAEKTKVIWFSVPIYSTMVSNVINLVLKEIFTTYYQKQYLTQTEISETDLNSIIEQKIINEIEEKQSNKPE